MEEMGNCTYCEVTFLFGEKRTKVVRAGANQWYHPECRDLMEDQILMLCSLIESVRN